MNQDDAQPVHPMDQDNQRKREFDRKWLALRGQVRMELARLEFARFLYAERHAFVGDRDDE